MHSDIRGLTLTTDSADAVEGFNETMRQYLKVGFGLKPEEPW